MRAISRLASFSRVVFSSAPVAAWKRRLKSSCRVSASRCSRSSSVRSRMSLARKQITTLPLHELRLHGELLRGETQRLLRERLRDTGELEHDAARLHDRHPALGRALALAHPGLGGLLRERLVGEDVDPDLSAALDLARHRDAGGLDLAVRDPAVLERLDAVVAEVHRCLAGREPTAPAAVHLPELGLLRKQHYERPPFAPLPPEPGSLPDPPCSPFAPDLSSFCGSSCCFFVVVESGAFATGAGVVSTCGSTGGCLRPSADTPRSSVRGFSTRVPSCGCSLRVRGLLPPPPPPPPPPPGREAPRERGAPGRLPWPPPPGRFWPPRWPGRPRRTGPRPSRSWLRFRPDSREAPSPSVTPPRRRAVSWSPRRVSFAAVAP